MTTISKDKIKDLYFINLLYEIHRVMEKIKLFENKYQVKFKEFEKLIKSQEENFTLWDDYMEWKAYEKKLHELKKEKDNLDAGNYTLS
ncbi:hypothetical protein [Thermodesulfovibrio yellowstonii]|uniref:Uncharacterized protein n=1 Tax=Thermodesulfovibrio yellowstonii (strain ATCC 51303 / DSM 11347 / YP87) TaxID=289376 RepID=B5YH44_THEYD|nr:hypothetical protein [Thermodesulfovibrio yellowstonii]ACI21409.1 conserved hypothetical protein [Thermodesulfovibrio yellowstonii DSM 11347]MDI6865030.1 hypothetical protein [Thermodesulfovibrio yellowstonii]